MRRKYSIDILRILSTLAVILIHVVTSPVSNDTNAIEASLENTLKIIHSFLLWAVPVFFMITGYCLMQKEECTYKYCFSKVLKYIAVLFTVGLLYALMERVFSAGTVNLTVIIKSVKDVITGNLWDHMWFVYSIIGVYLVMPLIHSFMKKDKRSVLIFTGLLFFFNIVCNSVKTWLPIGVTLPFSGYLFYVCFGCVIAKFEIRKKLLYLSCATGVISAVCMVIYPKAASFGYNHIFVCLIAMCIFLLISKMEVKQNKFLLSISQCTWGVYLLHPLFINIAIKVLKVDLLTSLPYLKLFIFAIIISAASFLTTYILRKIPIIKKLF